MIEPAKIARTLTSVPNFYRVLFAVSFSVKSLGLGLECDAHRVDAVAISSWGLWRIIKYVSEVPSALRASNLGADHAVGSVLDVFNSVIVLRLVETWPTSV